MLSSLLVACGGGGGEDDAADAPQAVLTAEGAYVGRITGAGSIDTFNTLVLNNGDAWTFYGSTLPSGVFAIGGFMQGGGSSNNGTYTSSDLRDFGASPADRVTSTARYDANARTLTGTFVFDQGTVSYSGNGNTAPYNYNSPASLSTVAGNWSLGTLTGETIALNIAANGSMAAVSNSGCSMTGTLAPHTSGKNLFSASLRFGPAPCALPDQTASGIVIAYNLTSTVQQFMFAGVDATRQFGTAAIGTR